MTIFPFDWRWLAYAGLLALVLMRAWGFRRQWISGVLDYGYNRVERASDPKRFRFWFRADVVVFALVILGVANWIAQI
jgi:hypothetical protein